MEQSLLITRIDVPNSGTFGSLYRLTLIDTRLLAYVARVYAHDLQTKSLKDIQPQLCDTMDSLLVDMSVQDDISVSYSRTSNQQRPRRFNPRSETAVSPFFYAFY